MRYLCLFGCVTFACLWLTACGQSGALYLPTPGNKPPAHQKDTSS